MGGGGSKSSGGTTAPAGPATLASLAATGRYVVLPRKGDAGDVHLIGVFPCSSTSGREVADLIALVQPRSIYVDLFPEQIELYKGEIKELMEAVDAMGPEKALAIARKKLGELPPISHFYTRARGLSIATELRHMMADEWFFRLLGVGRDAPYMTAIVHAVANPDVTLAGYPLPLSYPSRAAVTRIAATMTSLVGDPPTYFNTLATLGLAGAQRPDVVFEMSVPPVGFFTYENIAQLRGEFERQVNDSMKQLTLSNCDAENTISTVAPPEVMSALVKQNYAAAHAIQSLPKGAVVAVVDIGRGRGIMKAWNAAQPAQELFPAQPWYGWERTQNKLFAAVGLSALSYSAYQGWKRGYKKTTVAIMLPIVAMMSSLSYAGMYRPEATYGSTMRNILANPKQPFGFP